MGGVVNQSVVGGGVWVKSFEWLTRTQRGAGVFFEMLISSSEPSVNLSSLSEESTTTMPLVHV